MALLATFQTAWNADVMAQRNLRQLYFNPVSRWALVLALPGFVLVALARPKLAALAVAVGLLLGFSLIPSLAFDAVPLTMMGVYVSLALLGYVIVAAMCSAASRAVFGDGFGRESDQLAN